MRWWERKMSIFLSLVPRPVRAICVTKGGLEPSAMCEFSHQAWQVMSHPKWPRTTGNEAAFFSLPAASRFCTCGDFHTCSRFARSKMGTTSSLWGMFISWKSNPSCNLCHFPGEDTLMKMMGILVLLLASSKHLDCGDDAKEIGVRSFLLFSYALRNLQGQGTGFDTFYFIKRNKALLWQGGIWYWSFLGLLKRLNRILWYYVFVRNGLSNIWKEVSIIVYKKSFRVRHWFFIDFVSR